MNWFEDGWGLSLVVFLPLVGAALIAIVGREDAHVARNARWVAL